jgi:hypothetical protein
VNATRAENERCLDKDDLFWIGIVDKALNSWFAIFLSLTILSYSIRFLFKTIIDSQLWKDSENVRVDLSRKVVKGFKQYSSSYPWSHHIIFFITSSAITLFVVWIYQSKIPFLNNHCN